MYLTLEMIVALIVSLWELRTLLTGNGPGKVRFMLILAGCATFFAALAWLQYDYRFGLDPMRAVIFAILLWIAPLILGLQWAIRRMRQLIHKKK